MRSMPGFTHWRDTMLTQPVRARMSATGAQVVDITVDHGYRPDAIVALEGIPLRLVFRRKDDDPCLDRVVFSSPRVDRRLAPWAATTIVLPAQPAGDIRFTCAMGRYRGHIELVPSGPRARGERVSTSASGAGGPFGQAIVPGICSLALVALVGAAAFDREALTATALFALVAWTAGCLWALVDRRHRT